MAKNKAQKSDSSSSNLGGNCSIDKSEIPASTIAQARDYYLTLLEEFPALIWQSGIDAKCNYFNKTWLAFTGRPIEKELGDGWADGVHPDNLARCVSEYLDAFHARREFELEYRLRRYDGEYRWIRDIGQPIYDLDGQFNGYLGSCYDITEHKEAEEAIKEREFFLNESQRVARLGSYNLDIRANRWTSSKELDTLFGIDADYQKNVDGWLALVHPDDRDEMAQYFSNEVLARRQRFSKEYRIKRWSDKQTLSVMGLGELTFDDNGNPVKMIGTIQDITERKQAEQERENLVANLQKALAEIKTLHGILPICSHCKKIRDDNGAWHQIETYISEHTDSQFSHGMCKECAKKYYPQYYKDR